ncbi:heme-binding protein [Ramlibacter monticola]|uniref:Heme-binding protein n=1 Tax=Ramlibacter monticola TaxID=1926872 RepID=A0A936Z5H8_9BURK|nr:heme-binding protein [Ramlibacter monticola]MBL0393967.1 heme-binding protein [Ramlibacter monticola]
MTHLSLQTANQIITAALAKARECGYKPMGVAVLDASGHLKAFASEDGASMFRFDIARAKAWGAVGMGVASGVLAQRAKDNPNFFVALAATAEGRFLPQPGAVVIKDAQGQVLGAVGASGGTGEEDEAICAAGVAAAGLVAG